MNKNVDADQKEDTEKQCFRNDEHVLFFFFFFSDFIYLTDWRRPSDQMEWRMFHTPAR